MLNELYAFADANAQFAAEGARARQQLGDVRVLTALRARFDAHCGADGEIVSLAAEMGTYARTERDRLKQRVRPSVTHTSGEFVRHVARTVDMLTNGTVGTAKTAVHGRLESQMQDELVHIVAVAIEESMFAPESEVLELRRYATAQMDILWASTVRPLIEGEQVCCADEAAEQQQLSVALTTMLQMRTNGRSADALLRYARSMMPRLAHVVARIATHGWFAASGVRLECMLRLVDSTDDDDGDDGDDARDGDARR
jgi:hypothetical protein